MENNSAVVSVLIRTCNRTKLLGRAIESVQRQTYKNIEIVVIEDGKNTSENFVKQNFPGLNIAYHFTGENMGRSFAGNLALAKATGKYCCFLDDDDFLFSSHIEQLVAELEKSECKIAYAKALECQIDACGREKRKFVRYNKKGNRLLLVMENFLPIQTVLFERSIYEKAGGFDTSLSQLEDWDLWIRFSLVSDLAFVNEVTSQYHTPYKNKQKKNRDLMLKNAKEVIMQKAQTYHSEFTVQQLNEQLEYIYNDYKRIGIHYYAKKIINFMLYQDK